MTHLTPCPSPSNHVVSSCGDSRVVYVERGSARIWSIISNISYISIEESYIAIIIVIVLSPSPISNSSNMDNEVNIVLSLKAFLPNCHVQSSRIVRIATFNALYSQFSHPSREYKKKTEVPQTRLPFSPTPMRKTADRKSVV